MSKDEAQIQEMRDDYAAQLEEKDAELDRACALLLDIEGAILGYWTDIPENLINSYRVRIREFLGDWEPTAIPPSSTEGAV